ncbi:efflux RND transporter periplasmic adaptor subunit [Hymenobacter nivis]|uniref:Efflux RND transporter periplasmic adaptor subunit n=1 Tax=Hymenobacter nivis TaxID=1850093 RepID=A0A502GMC9_9BACT|nr:efflux RND transporter periplasmic adaptor subunit [Hymenobacter nivis]TPG63011.1 efflux RND transporter periplasmic adaptor subunit [Hymenobacter nivis]
MNSLFRRVLLRPFALAAAAGGLLLSGCGKGQAETAKADAAPQVPVVALRTTDQRLYHEHVADIQAERNVEVRAKVRGFLDHIFVDEGKFVKKGQALFQINPSEYQNQLASARAAETSAEAEVASARVQLGRVQLLVGKNIIAKTETDLALANLRTAQSHVAEARARQATARLNLNYTLVRAPFDGIINRIPLKVGSLIEDTTLLTTVSDLSQVLVYFEVPENEYLELTRLRQEHPDQSRSDTIALVLADGSRYPYPGYIETSEGEIDENTGSIAFRARFDNPQHLLKHGATGRVRLTNVVNDALLVPQKAVFEIQDKSYVYVLDSNNVAHTRSFIPGTRTGDDYVVKSGLKRGERVVYEGTQQMKDGMKVVPRKAEVPQQTEAPAVAKVH